MNVNDTAVAPVKDENDNIIADIKYTIRDKHRDQANPESSYWTISEDEEFDLFVSSWMPCWLTLPNVEMKDVKVGKKTKKRRQVKKGIIFGKEQSLPTDAFGILYNGGVWHKLGRTRPDFNSHGASVEDKRSDTFVARFEADVNTGNKSWHGYPADWEHLDRDVPDSCYLKQWASLGLMSPAKINKILNHKPRK